MAMSVLTKIEVQGCVCFYECACVRVFVCVCAFYTFKVMQCIVGWRNGSRRIHMQP